MTIVPNSLHEPTVKTDTKFVDFCRDVQKSQVDVEMFSENRAKLPHITLYNRTPSVIVRNLVSRPSQAKVTYVHELHEGG